MNFVFYLFLGLAVGLFARDLSAQAPTTVDRFAGVVALLESHHHPEASGPAITLEEAERIALARNPEIEVAVRRVRVREAHALTAGALDDPMAMYRGWEVPLEQPWNYNAAQNMFSLSQNLPGPGKRALRTGIADPDVAEAKAELEQVRLNVHVSVRKAFNDMLRANEEIQIHDQHVGIARQAIEAARIKYEVGKVQQQDMLKANIALTRLAEHMIHFDQDAGLARAQLNVLLGRDPAEPLNVVGGFAVKTELPALKSLDDIALQSRPDLIAAREAADKSHKLQALARKAHTPDFTVSAGYMLMPSGTNMRNDYMVEGTMNLPWLNRKKHDAEIAEASAQTTEQDAELAAMRSAALGQIEVALVQAQAAQQLAHMYGDQLRPQAEAALQSSVIAYENDKVDFLDLLDSQMTVVDADLAWIQAVADYDARLADLELATGAAQEEPRTTTTEVKP
jgi:cobalt-zinc-cadmium efflux system outer membrane protein